jgi:hypothetical protein
MLGSDELERVGWFCGIVLMVLLAMGGVKVHPGPPLEQAKIHQTLKRVKKPGEGENVIQKLFKTHNRGIVDVKEELRNSE